MRFSKIRDVKTPEYGTPGSAGIDFFVPFDFEETKLYPGDDLLINSGIKMELPEGFMLMGADKSGVATSNIACIRAGRPCKPGAFSSSLIVGAKIIDQDYQGEIGIHIINVGQNPVIIRPGMKIAQFILVPILQCPLEEVPAANLFSSKTERGEGGFGSTH